METRLWHFELPVGLYGFASAEKLVKMLKCAARENAVCRKEWLQLRGLLKADGWLLVSWLKNFTCIPAPPAVHYVLLMEMVIISIQSEIHSFFKIYLFLFYFISFVEQYWQGIESLDEKNK